MNGFALHHYFFKVTEDIIAIDNQNEIIGRKPDELSELLEQVDVQRLINENILCKIEVTVPKDGDDKKKLNDHHLENKRYKCDFCEETFSQKYQRYTHYRRVHK